MSRRTRSASEPTSGSLADLQAEADPAQAARTIVLRRLTAAPRTYAQLRDGLLERGFEMSVITAVLDRYVEVGLINDSEFAEMWVRSRHSIRGNARSVLRRELRDKGVPTDDAEVALATITDAAERERAGELVRRKLASTVRLEHQARVRRLTSMLARRGYPPGICFGVVKEVLDDPDTHELLDLHDVQIDG
jgi:regulatory protein